MSKQSGVSSHTHTDPSPGVSSETSLESRSQDLIEKSLTALSETDSPPAQKYLNTRATREAKLTSQPIQNISLAQDSRGMSLSIDSTLTV